MPDNSKDMKNILLLIFIALINTIFSQVNNLERLELRVQDFGVSGDGKTDDGTALRKLFEKASALQRPARIIFQKDATYYLGKVDNHPIGSLFLDRAEDLIIEGNNALLLVDPNRRPFEMYRCKNIILRNFRIDHSPLSLTTRMEKLDIGV